MISLQQFVRAEPNAVSVIKNRLYEYEALKNLLEAYRVRLGTDLVEGVSPEEYPYAVGQGLLLKDLIVLLTRD